MIEVKVPATSANMGPGFDCMGVALNLYNRFYFEEIASGIEISGCEESFRNEDNLIYLSMRKCFERIGFKSTQKGIRIRIESEIPVSRGLGSSAACILGGILAANEIGSGSLRRSEVLELASEIEGHPDNIAPALFGGITVAIKEGGRVYYERVQVPEGLKFCAIIPEFKLSTKSSRAVLPESIPHKDGVFNTGRASLFIAALVNKNFDLFQLACKDRLHEKYRGNLINNYNEIFEKCVQLNSLCTFLSGAGPTIMVLLREADECFIKQIEDYLSGLNDKWTVKELKPDVNGAVIRNI